MPDLTDALRQLAEIRPDLIRFSTSPGGAESMECKPLPGIVGFTYSLEDGGTLSPEAKARVHLWLLALARAEGLGHRMGAFPTAYDPSGLYRAQIDRMGIEQGGDGEDYAVPVLLSTAEHADPTTALALALVEALRTDP